MNLRMVKGPKRLDVRNLQGLPPEEIAEVLDSYEHEALELLQRGADPKAKRSGQRLLIRVDKLRQTMLASSYIYQNMEAVYRERFQISKQESAWARITNLSPEEWCSLYQEAEKVYLGGAS